MTVKPLRVGVIGAKIDAWRAVPGVEVAAICTSRRETAEAEAAARETGVPVQCGMHVRCSLIQLSTSLTSPRVRAFVHRRP